MRILLFKDQKYWVAQSLEEDLSTQDLELELAITKWRRLKLSQDYFHRIYKCELPGPAAPHFFEKFESAQALRLELPDLDLHIDNQNFYYIVEELKIRILER